MKRRDFLKISGAALGGAALLRFTTTTAAASLLAKKNGEAPTPFSIVQLSDTHVGFQGPPDPLGTKAFERAVDLINDLHPRPDLILFTGDLTHDSEDPAEHAKRMKSFRPTAPPPAPPPPPPPAAPPPTGRPPAEPAKRMKSFRTIADRLRVKTRYHVPGEHDAALDGGVLFRENFGETHYSFDHRGVHFIALDNVSLGKPIVGAAQLAWLKNDLARYPKTAPIIVFTHRPLFDLRSDWEWFTGDGDAVTNAVAPYDNVSVLYGHIHRVDHHTTGKIQHHAARSLIFGFPDPAATADKKPPPFDAAEPFRNLGIRQLRGAPPSIDDVELTSVDDSGLTAILGNNGIQQFAKGDFA